ncbi:MAG: glycosyltransferase [Solirubrobacterales bacterium]|nr:glycosyltransferase [Solirubrobacterales bacterium]HMT04285.1 glycosyltransferase [Solirubrobacterales bacterium]
MPSSTNHPIAICMATYEPDADLFARQIESIRSQTSNSWICLISDDHSTDESVGMIEGILAGDERFRFSRSRKRLGFYRNFERALGMVPPECELVALSDQDDFWHPEKLETLAGLIGGRNLVYSDMRLTLPDGTELSPTFWRGRRNEYGNLASVMIANTITGSASLFRRELLDTALPFPENPGWQFHDHWLAICALATGEVGYSDRALYDYIQHAGAVLGQVSGSGTGSRLKEWLRELTGFGNYWRAGYYFDVLRLQAQATALLERTEAAGEQLDRGKASTLRRFSRAERSILTLIWLLVRPFRALVGRNETLGSETCLSRGLLWRRITGIRQKLPLPEPPTGPPPGDPGAYGPRGIRRWRAGQIRPGA